MANGFYNSTNHGTLTYVQNVVFDEGTNQYSYGNTVECDANCYIAEPTGANTYIDTDLTGKYLILKPGVYDGWFAVLLISGTQGNPALIRVANGGQAIIKGNFKLGTTSKYVDILGINETFRGHADDGIRRIGQQALIVTPGWEGYPTYSNTGISIGETSVSNIHIRFVESGNAEYTPFTMKNDNKSSEGGGAMMDMIVDDCLFHTAKSGEGAYIGSTQGNAPDGNPQHEIQLTSMRRNLFMFCGTEGFQVGHVVDGTNIENNIIVANATDWKTAFEPYQDKATQIAYRTGGVSMSKNIVIGAGEMFCFIDEKSMDGYIIPHTNGEKVILDRNLWWGTRNFGFYRRASTNRGIGVVMSNSWAGNSAENFGEIYAANTLHYESFLGGDQLAQVEMINFEINTSATGSDSGPITKTNVNFQSSNVPIPQFVNGGDLVTNWEKYEIWDSVHGNWGIQSGTPILYSQGDRVFRWDTNTEKVRIYESKINQTESIDPRTDNGTYYDDVTDSVYGATDFRLVDGTIYASEGLGFGSTTVVNQPMETLIEMKLTSEADSAYFLIRTINGRVINEVIESLNPGTSYTFRITERDIESGKTSEPLIIIQSTLSGEMINYAPSGVSISLNNNNQPVVSWVNNDPLPQPTDLQVSLNDNNQPVLTWVNNL